MQAFSIPTVKHGNLGFRGPTLKHPESPATIATSFPELLSVYSIQDSQSFAQRNDVYTFANKNFSQVLTTKSNQTESLSAFDADVTHMTEDQVQELVRSKMQRLELYNSKLLCKEHSRIIKKYKLSSNQVKVICRLQKRIRGWIFKKKFFRALRMNDYFEHGENVLMLKRCLARFEKRMDIPTYDGSFYDDMNGVPAGIFQK